MLQAFGWKFAVNAPGVLKRPTREVVIVRSRYATKHHALRPSKRLVKALEAMYKHLYATSSHILFAKLDVIPVTLYLLR
jgi:hypothetical protein